MYFQNPKCQCIIAFLLTDLYQNLRQILNNFWQCGILINMFNPDCRLIIQLNLQTYAFALIHSLQIFSIWLFTIDNRPYVNSPTKSTDSVKRKIALFGVQDCRTKFFDKISGCAHEWGCVVQKKTLVKSVKTLLSNCKYREISENWPLQLFL